jgi:hypothetical protein
VILGIILIKRQGQDDNKYNSGDLPEGFDHFIDGGSLLTHLIPTLPYQVLDLEFDLFWQFGPETLLCELGLHLLKG